MRCCVQKIEAGTLVYDDGSCGAHALTDRSGYDVCVRPRPRADLAVVWLGGHPAVKDPESGRRGRFYRCLRCHARDGWDTVSCKPGLIVHLADPGQTSDMVGRSWGSEESIKSATAYWLRTGFKVMPNPGGCVTYRPCPVCNQADLPQH